MPLTFDFPLMSQVAQQQSENEVRFYMIAMMEAYPEIPLNRIARIIAFSWSAIAFAHNGANMN